MKPQYILTLLLMFFANHAFATEYIGEVVFYSYSDRTNNSQAQDEVDSDFSYNVGGLTKILDKKRIKSNIKDSSEFTVLTKNGKKFRITKKQIPVSAGYIMIRRNGEFLIRNGIGTDVDMMFDIYNYFGIKQ